jgi:hypothetical protein
MSYQKKTPYGQYVQVAGLGADPWADAASGEVKPVTGGTQSEGGGLFDFLFKPSAPAPAPKPAAPSTVSQVGAGIGAFLKGLAPTPPTPAAPTPVMPVHAGGMSTTTKLALAGGGALLLVLFLTRD